MLNERLDEFKFLVLPEYYSDYSVNSEYIVIEVDKYYFVIYVIFSATPVIQRNLLFARDKIMNVTF